MNGVQKNSQYIDSLCINIQVEFYNGHICNLSLLWLFQSIMVPSNNMDELYGYAGISTGLAGYSEKVVIGPDQTDCATLRNVADTINSEGYDI